jgi:peptide/nickel transport system permease protein
VETVSLAEYALRRLLWTVPLLLLVMLATFTLLRGAGGDPFNPPPNFSGVPLPLQNDLRAYYRLDEPWFVEFAVYVRNVFTFDFGPSLVQRDLRVDDVIEQSFPITLGLVGLAALWAVPTGTALGVYAASRRGSAADAAVTALASVALVVPVFFVAFVLARYGVRDWELAPPGWDTWDARVMPAFALGLAPMGYVARLVRAAFVEELDADFVRTARAKGLSGRAVLWRHVLRNAMIPVVNIMGLQFANLLTGTVVIENVFYLPGIGRLVFQAIANRDLVVVRNVVMLLAAFVIVINFVVDVLYALIDPRLKAGDA